MADTLTLRPGELIIKRGGAANPGGPEVRVPGVVLIDPATGLPTSPGGGGGGGTTTVDTSDLAKEATQLVVSAKTTSIDTTLSAINAKIPVAPATVSGQDATNLILGTRADAVATTDTGSFSLASLVKRALQNWTTLLGRLPASLGVKAGSASMPVVLASDQAAVNVVAVTRACTGRQTLTLAAGVVTTLTVPGGSVAADIQADGNSIRITLDGATAPSSTTGTRVDDGVIYSVTTSLANVKMLAPVACSAQVVYFDKA